MGGALSLSSSILADGLDAAAPFYGVADLGDPAQAKVPLQLHFGTNGKISLILIKLAFSF